MNQEFNICQHNVLDTVCDDTFIQSGCIYVPPGAQEFAGTKQPQLPPYAV